jgi:type II secretion system protein I
MRSCSQTPSRGFTIVEVLVAMTVCGVGLIAVFQAMRIASDAAERISNEATAQLLAESHLISILSRPLSQMGTHDGSEGKFTWIEQIRPSKHPKLAEVVVQVKWRQRGRNLAFRLASLKAME